MAESNENVYGVTTGENKDQGNNGVVGSEKATTEKQDSNGGADTGEDTSVATGPEKTEDDKVTKDQTPKKQEWDAKVDDADKQRTLNVTESDGTTIKFVLHFPGIFEAENILGNGTTSTVYADGSRSQKSTMGDFHNALLSIFGATLVNGGVQALNEDFFYDHELKTYRYVMDQAESFLSNPNGAFKSGANN